MDIALHVLGVMLLLLTCLAALASLVVGMPGTFFIVANAMLYAWMTDFQAVQWSTIGWLSLLALSGEGLEFFSGLLTSASQRPSRRVIVCTILGGFIGGLLGTPFFFGAGALPGALFGAFAGAALAVRTEGGGWHAAFSSGMAAFWGRLFGFIGKTAIAVVMVIILLATAW